MTLVAAFRAQGIPVLVGDMLVTANPQPGERSYLPTHPEAAAAMPEKLGRRIVGSKKKVHILSPGLAVAWSGSELGARTALKELAQTRPGTLDEVRRVLAAIQHLKGESEYVHVIGWIHDGAPHCFRWNSAWPSEIYYDESHVDGSGERLLRIIFDEQVLGRGLGPGLTPIESACLLVLSKCARLIEEEAWSAATLAESFGYCYEIAILDDRGFRYIDEITYLLWHLRRDAEGPGHFYTPSPIMLKYKSIGMASVVQTHRTDGKPNVFDLVTSVFDSLPSVDPSDIGIFSLASPYYCSLVRYEQSGDVLTCSFVNGAEDPVWVTHERKDGKDHFHLKMNAILPLIDRALVRGN